MSDDGIVGMGAEVLSGRGIRAVLARGDCMELMPFIPSGSVDAIVTDLPYGVLNRKSEGGGWDSVIPLGPLWAQFLRIAKQGAAIVLFSQGMFTARLMTSQPSIWRYNLIWDKCRSSGFLNSGRMPLRSHEDICVFYRRLPTYNPQLAVAERGMESHTKGRGQYDDARTNRCYGKFRGCADGDLSLKYPGSILRFPRPHCTGNHPTEKSAALCEWLVRSYTNEGGTVLDATMGSGTTGVACVRTGRSFIGIEREDKYYGIARQRIRAEIGSSRQEELDI